MIYFEDFQVGQKVVTRGRTVTEADITMFAALSGDWYGLHVNEELAKKSIFGGRIAHGFLVLSIASGFVTPYDVALIAFYGMDKVRFTAPTKLGDTIHLVTEVIEMQDKGDLGVVANQWHIKNQRDEDVAVLVTKVAVAKRPKT
ncbi:MAG: MaoC/PaaZ C-terminal domain-containing protein [Chloroflexi bacterium]|nr:MaoC/PaaZ C-terminal domain-containing protein [Chloroflexota bacterium]